MRWAKRFLASLALLGGLLAASPVQADAPPTPDDVRGLMCPDAGVWGAKLVSGVCWSCLFPLRIMGADIGGGEAPAGAANQAFCACPDELGIPEPGMPLGAWMPVRLIELVRQPYCSPSLGGVVLHDTLRRWGSNDGAEGGVADNQFYSYHYFAFPLLAIIELIAAAECHPGGHADFDLMYLSELDPTWNEDELALYTHPEVAVFANPLLQAACPADCVAASAGQPIDGMYWCAGCWGSLYPFTDNVPAGGSPPRVTSLLASRALAALHRRGLAWDTVGEEHLCGASIAPLIPKSQYKLSMLFPLAEADGAGPVLPEGSGAGGGAAPPGGIQSPGSNLLGGCCHPIGASTFFWGEWRNLPAVGEDYVYLLWRWTDCCVR